MKFNKLALITFIVLVLLTISAVSANNVNVNQTEDSLDLLGENQNSIYVDAIFGLDSNNGFSNESSVKTISKAISISGGDDNIYLADGTYSGLENTRLNITKSLNFIGSGNTIIDGKNKNYLFIISDNITVTFKNIQFVNAYKSPNSYSVHYNHQVYGAAIDIKNSNVVIDNCTFKNNVLYYDTIDESIYGGAISNFGDLTILNSYFENNTALSTSGLLSYGGCVYNKGRLLINSSVLNKSKSVDFGYGAGIGNDGYAVIDSSVITNSYTAQECKGSAIYNAGELILTNSKIENNHIKRASFDTMFGAIYNSGNFTAYGNIFRNNTAYYQTPMSAYKGSPNIYNCGNLNLTYNAFTDNLGFEGISQDVYIYSGDELCLDYNWWGTNENPFTDLNRINVDLVNSWLIFNLIPDYTKLDIGDDVEISAFWSISSNVLPKIELLPIFNVTFMPDNIVKALTGGETSFIFNHSQVKSSWIVTASIGSFSQGVIVDVGKIYTDVNIASDNNITYGDDLNINIEVTSHDSSVVEGNVSVIINDNVYTVSLTNGKANITVSNLVPGKHIVKVRYNGNDDYFKAFNNETVNVEKQDVNMSLTIPEIYIDQKGRVIVTLLPKGVQGQAFLYINGVRKKIVYLYNGNTTISLSNFAEGEYNITVEFVETMYYKSFNASGVLKVNKYVSALNLSVEDVYVGENVTIKVIVSPDSLRGEATLIINNFNTTINLDNATTTVSLSNLTGGTYNVMVLFKGDSKYYPSNASATFKVLKANSSLNVKLNYDENKLNGTITVECIPNNCTGVVGVYINYKEYKLNLTGGKATFNVNYYKGTNYIYVYYDGDKYHYGCNWNTTIGVADEFVFIGKNVTGWQYNDFNYTVRLLEVNGVPLPSRTLTITFEGKSYNVTTNSHGFAEFNLNLPSGEYSIATTYKNTTIYNTITVKDIKFNLTSKNIIYGENGEFKASFDEGISGKVNFIIDGILNVSVNIVNKTAVFNLSGIDAGSYTLKAIYTNDLFSSNEVLTTFIVKKVDASYNLVANDVTPEMDQIISLSNLGNATGEITFVVNGTVYREYINNSQVSIKLSGLQKGNYSFVISYGGDKNYNNFTISSVFYVKSSYSNVVLKINNAHYGENLAAIVILDTNATGTVRFSVGHLIKDVEIKNGIAKWSFTGLNAGKYNISANYLGNHYYISSANVTSFEVQKANSTIVLYTKGAYLGENIRIYANLSTNATGVVSFSMLGYYTPRDKVIVDSTANWYISPLKTGSYTVIAKYKGDSNYCPSNTTFILNITQKKAILNVSINDVGLNDRIIAKITLVSSEGEKLNATIKLIVNSKSYSVTIRNGALTFVIGKLNEGSYTYSGTFEGDDNYSSSYCEGNFEVSDNLLDVNVTVSDIEMFYKGSEKLTISLVSAKGKVLSGENVFVIINNKNYKLTTDVSGKAYLILNLTSGNYTAYVYFNETTKYKSANASANVMIFPTVEGIDVVKLYGSGTQYFAVFCDSNGKVLANTKVTFKIGTKTFTTKTLPNGISRLNINFAPGSYIISTVNPVTGEKVTNKIFIYNYLVENKDIIQYWGAKKVYKVRAYGHDGKHVGAGVCVKIKVGGKTYNVKTDKKGYASLVINLKVGLHTIKSTYNKYSVSNKIMVKSIIITDNFKVKKGKKIKYAVKLVNKKGKILKGKKITFKFKGKKYTSKTNKKGNAIIVLNIPYKVGNYKIVYKYGKFKIAKTIKVIN